MTVELEHNRAYYDEPFDQYLRYLATVEDRLEPSVYAFAADPRRHDFGANSLHDSRVESLGFWRKPLGGEVLGGGMLGGEMRGGEMRGGEMRGELVLAGPERDRRFRLTFAGVESFDGAQIAGDLNSDLITFEIVAEDADSDAESDSDSDEGHLITFRALFASEPGHIVVRCRRMTITEELTARATHDPSN